MTDPLQRTIPSFFPRKREHSEDEPVEGKRSRTASQIEEPLQELSIHHILPNKVCAPPSSLEGVVRRIISIYNDKKESKYQQVTGFRLAESHFEWLVFTQAVPLKSRMYCVLTKMGGQNLRTAQKVNYLFFLYRESPRDLFALTTGDAGHVVRPYIDYTFPGAVARRLLDPDKISIIAERFLVGNDLSNERIARDFATRQDTLVSFITAMRCRFRDGASIFAFQYFQEKEQTPSPTNVNIGAGIVRICKRLPLSAFPAILDHFSKILRKESTVHHPNNTPEIDEPGFNFLDYFVPVRKRLLITELNRNLEENVWDAFKNQEESDFDFRHKYTETYSKADSFSLQYDDYKHEWHTVLSATEMLKLIRDIPGWADLSKQQFLNNLKNLEVSFVRAGVKETAKFMDYLEGIVRDKEQRPFWRLRKTWYQISLDYLKYVQTEFKKFCKEDSLKDFLPKEWPFPTESSEQKKSIGSKREETENKYNQQYLKLPRWIVGDKICPEGIELFDLLLYGEDGSIYCVHVKHGFGTSTRDACSQLRNSAQYFHDALRIQGPNNKLELFYNEAVNSSCSDPYRQQVKTKLQESFPTKEEFLTTLTESKRVVFVYAFADDAKGVRYLTNPKNLKTSLSSQFGEESSGIFKSLEDSGIVDSDGGLTESSHSLTQEQFQEQVSYGTQRQRKAIFKAVKETRSLSDTSRSTIAKLEILHAKREIKKLGFDFKICQIPRTDYSSTEDSLLQPPQEKMDVDSSESHESAIFSDQVPNTPRKEWTAEGTYNQSEVKNGGTSCTANAASFVNFWLQRGKETPPEPAWMDLVIKEGVKRYSVVPKGSFSSYYDLQGQFPELTSKILTQLLAQIEKTLEEEVWSENGPRGAVITYGSISSALIVNSDRTVIFYDSHGIEGSPAYAIKFPTIRDAAVFLDKKMSEQKGIDYSITILELSELAHPGQFGAEG